MVSTRWRRFGVGVLVVALGAAACGDDATESQPPPTSSSVETATTSDPTTSAPTTSDPTTSAAVDELQINDLRVIGSHNSYHLRPEPDVYDAIAVVSEALAESIDYSHRSLTDQLEEFGIRQFEIDVFADPAGGLFADRAALPVVGRPVESGLAELDAPGFKVLHTQDFDFGSNCLTLERCLGEIAVWSDAHPDHLPLMIMIEVKDESVPESAAAAGLELPELPIEWTIPMPTDATVLDALDDELVAWMGRERIITPDDVRGDAATLEEVILADGWPTIDDSRGKVMFAMVNLGDVREIYRDPSPTLADRVMFTTSEPGDPDGAFLRIDDPITGAEEIARRAAQGYLIRTRTDTPTAEAREGDTARREAAITSGAHFLSTDYYIEDPGFGTGYAVAVGDRCNPVSAPPECALGAADG